MRSNFGNATAVNTDAAAVLSAAEAHRPIRANDRLALAKVQKSLVN
jgi:hypothetical protein